MRRVVTLFPAATEIVAALGGIGRLVGISHECDYPPSIRHLPRVTATPIDPRSRSASIDAEVRRLRDSGQPVISVDAAQLRALAPDLIITQDLCEVCAVSDGVVHRLASVMRPAPRVVALAARDLEGICQSIGDVGAALDLSDEAEELVFGLRSRLRSLGSTQPAVRPRVVCIEWLDPLFLAGHWIPELVTLAGGDDVGARPGSHSAQRDWAEVEQLQPDHLFVMLCGFGIDRARTELESLENSQARDLMRRVPTWLIDGNAYTSRPGPRVVDGGAQIQAAILGQVHSKMERWSPVEVC
jgi:iron complex transport system substrate-binding protein